MPPLHWRRTLLYDVPSQPVSKTLHGTQSSSPPFPAQLGFIFPSFFPSIRGERAILYAIVHTYTSTWNAALVTDTCLV